MVTATPLYNGTVNLEFDEKRHIYSVEGVSVPSVTGIISVLDKPALIWWAAKMAGEYVADSLKPGVALDEVQIKELVDAAIRAHRTTAGKAATIGTIVHDWIRQWIADPQHPAPVNMQVQAAVERFKDWVVEKEPAFEHSERKIYSRKYGYAGTLDFTCRIGKHWWLGDIKTSDAIYPEYLLQCAAYMAAIQEEIPERKYKGMLIVRCGKDGSLEVVQNTEYRRHFKAFLSTLELWKWKKSMNGGKK